MAPSADGFAGARALAALGMAALLAGCVAGPDFRQPGAPSAARYTGAGLPAETASAPTHLGEAQRFDAEMPERWWRQLGSPRLDALVERALTASPGLEAARATLRQARELHAAQAGATLYPQVDAGASAQRQRSAPAAAGPSAAAQEFSVYNASVNVRYQFDLAGGNRRALEASESRAEVRRHELEAARLALAGNVATTAITLASLSAQIRASERMIAAQQEQLALAGERVRLGHAALGEQLALQAQLERSRAELPQLRKQHQQAGHLLAVLAGREPGEPAATEFELEDFVLPASLPMIVPSELVRRRPDIQAAEATLRAANAEYGVAVAKLYPQLNLSASLGSQALTAAALFGGGSAVWSLAGQLTQPLFRPGLPAEKRAALAAFDTAAANYRSVVLEALRAVADVLRAIEQDAASLRAHAAAAAAAEGSLQQARQRHALGAASYLEVLDASRQAQQATLALASSQARRLLDTVSLYVALGGDAR